MSILSLHDGVYATVQTPVAGPVPGNPNLPSFLVGTAGWGALNTPYPISTIAQAKDAFGEVTQNTHDLMTQITMYLYACAAMGSSGNLWASRVDDTTSTACTMKVKDTVQPTAGDVLLITAKCNGTRALGGTVAVTAASSWTSTQPVYNITLTIPFGLTEIFQNVIAWKYSGGIYAYDATTFVTNAVAAINKGQSFSRGPSLYWIASAPNTQSTVVPNLTTIYSPTGVPSGSVGTGTAGTDGANVTSSQLLGTDGISGRTGIFAERGLNCGTFAVAGLTDFTVSSSFTAFAAPGYKVFVGPSFPSGTSTTSAISTKITNSVASINQAVLKNWVLWYDYTIQQPRLVSPEGVALGIISSLSPEKPVGNQPVNGCNGFLLGTDQNGVPISDPELDALTGAGIICIGPLARNASLIGTVGGENASGISGQDGVNYTRLTGYLVKSLKATCAPFVDSLQSTQANDPTRRLVKKAIDNFMAALAKNGQIDTWLTTCDLTNNTPTTIAAGQLNVTVMVKYLATVRYINLNIIAGVAVEIDTSASNSVKTAS